MLLKWKFSNSYYLHEDICCLRALAAVYLQNELRSVALSVRPQALPRPVSGRSYCWEGLGAPGFVGFCLNHVVLFNFLLMGLTDLISCLCGKDNRVANPLILVGISLQGARATLSK